MEARFRVLVVDDDRSVRALLRILLEDRVAVSEAADGMIALRQAWDLKPQIIVLDRDMPSMTGDETAPYLRTLSPRSKIVAFSAALTKKPLWADSWAAKGDPMAVLNIVLAELALAPAPPPPMALAMAPPLQR